MSFKDAVAADIKNVFLNGMEFGEERTIIYDGQRYEDIMVVISGVKEKDRQPTVQDHAMGLYRVSATLHCSIDDLGGKQPEKGQKIRISTQGNKNFFQTFWVAKSDCELGMLRVELEAIEE